MAIISDTLQVVYILILHPKSVSWAWDLFIYFLRCGKLFNGVKNVHRYSKFKRIKEKV